MVNVALVGYYAMVMKTDIRVRELIFAAIVLLNISPGCICSMGLAGQL